MNVRLIIMSSLTRYLFLVGVMYVLHDLAAPTLVSLGFVISGLICWLFLLECRREYISLLLYKFPLLLVKHICV